MLPAITSRLSGYVEHTQVCRGDPRMLCERFSGNEKVVLFHGDDHWSCHGGMLTHVTWENVCWIQQRLYNFKHSNILILQISTERTQQLLISCNSHEMDFMTGAVLVNTTIINDHQTEVTSLSLLQSIWG